MKLAVSGTLLRFVGFQREIRTEAENVEGALVELSERFPAVRAVLFDDDGDLRGVHQLFVNGKQLDRSSDLGAVLPRNSHLDILTAIAGG